MKVTATFPDGTVRRLLHIPEWSFHWQQDYRYVTPIPLPRGTRIEMRYTYDNSEENDDNPQAPARARDTRAEVHGRNGGARPAADAAVTRRRRDDRRVVRRARSASRTSTVAEARARETPGKRRGPRRSSAAATSRSAATPRPSRRSRAALRLDERLADAHNDLGTALMQDGTACPKRFQHLRRAVALAPNNEVMLFNLGNGLKDRGASPTPRPHTGARCRSIPSSSTRTRTWGRCSSRRDAWPTPCRTSSRPPR